MAEEEKEQKAPAAKKPAATKTTAAKATAAKKPAAAKETAAKAEKPAAKATATKATATKAAAAKAEKPAAKATATKAAAAKAEKPAAEKAPAKKPAAKKPAAEKAPAKAESATEVKAQATKPAAKRPAAKKAETETSEPLLKVHHLRPAAGAKKDRTRVGRGEGSKGKTAGRGTKGTKARYQVKSFIEGGGVNYIMRTPKLRGFKNPFRVEYQVVNLEKLGELYPKGGEVTVGDLVAKGAVRKNEKVKILGNGEISVRLDVTVDKVSGSAQQKIIAAGGTVK